MEHHFIYFFVIVASSIAAIITFSIAAIIFYKERIEKKIDFNISVYKKYAQGNILGHNIPFREVEPTTNAFDLFVELFICEQYIKSYMKVMEEKNMKLEKLKYQFKIVLEAIKNVEFYVVNYRRSLLCFWASFLCAIFTIIVCLVALWTDLYAFPFFNCLAFSAIFAIITVLFICFLLFNIFQEPRRKEHLERIKEYGITVTPRYDEMLSDDMVMLLQEGVQGDIKNLTNSDFLKKIGNVVSTKRFYLLLEREGVRNLWTQG